MDLNTLPFRSTASPHSICIPQRTPRYDILVSINLHIFGLDS